MYFVDDVGDPEWKVVIHKEPRSKCVVSERDGETLSAAGHVNATRLASYRARDGPRQGGVGMAEPVLVVDVAEVLEHQAAANADAPDEDTEDVDDDDDEDNSGADAGDDARDSALATDIAVDL